MRSVAALLSSLPLLAASASATTFTTEQTTCPVCDQGFEVLVVLSTNSFGGTDLDFCPHPRGSATIPYGVWTCPGCGYSAWAGDFEKPVDEEFRRKVREDLRAPIELDRAMGQNAIPGWVKYDLLATILGWRGANEMDLATVYLYAAWSERSESDGAGGSVRRDASLEPAMKALGEEVKTIGKRVRVEHDEARPFLQDLALADGLEAVKGGDDVDRLLRRWAAAAIRRQRGELTAGEAVFAALAAEDSGAPESVRASARAHLDSIALERRFLSRAAESLSAALEKGLVLAEEIGPRRLQLAEAYRHGGRTADASTSYRSILEGGSGPPWLVELAEEGLQRNGDSYRLTDEKRDEMRLRRAQELVALLSDPEKAGDAADELATLDEPLVHDSILEALEKAPEGALHPIVDLVGRLRDPEGKGAAALARLARESADEQLRALAVESLGRLGSPAEREALLAALDDPSALVSHEAIRALVRFLDPALAPHFRRLAGDFARDESVRRQAIQGLGLAGDREAIPLLVELHDTLPRDTALALDRIANTAFWPHIPLTARSLPPEALDGLRKWWEAHREEDRKVWLLAGFQSAGYEVTDLGEADVPALLRALQDEKASIRANAWRVLHDLTGQSFGQDELLGDEGFGGELYRWEGPAAEWANWWRESKR